MAYCPQCGNEVDSDQEYCEECGTELSNNQSDEDNSKEESQQESQDNSKRSQTSNENSNSYISSIRNSPVKLFLLIGIPALIFAIGITYGDQFIQQTSPDPSQNDLPQSDNTQAQSQTNEDESGTQSSTDSDESSSDGDDGGNYIDDTEDQNSPDTTNSEPPISITQIYSIMKHESHDKLTKINENEFQVPKKDVYTYIVATLEFSEDVNDVKQSLVCDSVSEDGDEIGAWGKDDSSNKFIQYTHEPIIEKQELHFNSQFSVASKNSDQFTFQSYDDYGTEIIKASGDLAAFETVFYASESAVENLDETTCDIKITTDEGHSATQSFDLMYN
jgi:hypothetical protein